jgi:hypothetical protein
MSHIGNPTLIGGQYRYTSPDAIYYQLGKIKRPGKIFLAYDFYMRTSTGDPLGTASAMDLGKCPWLSDHNRQTKFNAVCADGHVETYDAIKHFNGGTRTNVKYTHTAHMIGYDNDVNKRYYDKAVTNPTNAKYYPKPQGDICIICGQ